MSQQDDTLRNKLQQQLEEIQQNGDDTDIARDLVEWFFQQLIELEFNGQIGAERYERSEGR